LKEQSKNKKIDIDWNFFSTKGIGGREFEPDTFQLAKTNMLISSGHLFNTLEQGDSIRDPIKNKYDIVLANPPFGIKGLNYKEIKSEYRDEYMPIESKSAVPLFLQAIISILKIDGRCAVVVPNGQELFGKNKALISLREYLRQNIYVTTSGWFSDSALKYVIDVMGIDRVLFSIDYPYEEQKIASDWIDNLDLPLEQKEKIAYKNAAKLLKIKM
jgi:type I restriction-modification system DNA methylase subunit